MNERSISVNLHSFSETNELIDEMWREGGNEVPERVEETKCNEVDETERMGAECNERWIYEWMQWMNKETEAQQVISFKLN